MLEGFKARPNKIDLDKDVHWQTRAACTPADADLFFIENPSQEDKEKREKLCHNCPVNTECLRDSLDNDEFVGYRAGLTEEQRRRMKYNPKFL